MLYAVFYDGSDLSLCKMGLFCTVSHMATAGLEPWFTGLKCLVFTAEPWVLLYSTNKVVIKQVWFLFVVQWHQLLTTHSRTGSAGNKEAV